MLEVEGGNGATDIMGSALLNGGALGGASGALLGTMFTPATCPVGAH
ncbi:MAG TPA: hypothetical protein VFW40_07960 [Capsulimonadaceae bacterium]|nr:hypothetical protein [Capsulimonadaceae bacterium]